MGEDIWMEYDQPEELRARLQSAQANGKVTILTPLPRHVRLRLWATSRIDAVGCWLIEHGHERAAVALWRACRMW